MIVYLNGQFLEEAAAHIPINDRGFLYGDGVFETIRAAGGRVCFWNGHLARLHRGFELLRLRPPVSDSELVAAIDGVLKHNRLQDAVIRVTVTRGSGSRGYSPIGANQPTLLITAHPAPEPFGGAPKSGGCDLVTSRYRIPVGDALSVAKHANRLLSVLARVEAEATGAHEGVLLNSEGQVAEAAGSNIFWLEAPDRLLTPKPDSGALLGVMREVLITTAPQVGLAVHLENASPSRLFEADGIFLTNSVQLLVPVRSYDGRTIPRSPWINLLIERLQLSP